MTQILTQINILEEIKHLKRKQRASKHTENQNFKVQIILQSEGFNCSHFGETSFNTHIRMKWNLKKINN